MHRSYNSRVLDRVRRAIDGVKPIWLYAGLIVIAIAFGLPLCRRAIILSDEGYLLQQSLDLLQGRVLYRDMDAFITPGMWFSIAGMFALFGPSVLTSRILILVAYVALMLVGFRIVERQTSRSHGLATVASLLTFSVWAFPAWTFAFYSPVAILLALAGLERLLTWYESRRLRDLFMVGLCLGLSICFKQNYGVFALLGAAIGYAAIKLESREPPPTRALSGVAAEMGVVTAGIVLAGLPVLVYLIHHDALSQAWYSLVVHPFEFGGRHDIPFAPISDLWRADLYKTAVEKLTYLSYSMLHAPPLMLLHSLRVVHKLHVLAYWLPLAIFVLGAGLIFLGRRTEVSRFDARLLAVVTTCGLLFMGVLPRADYNHLANVYQPVLIAAPIVLHRFFASLPTRQRMLRVGLLVIVTVVALAYGGVATHWYMHLIRQHGTLLEQPRGGVLVTAREAYGIEHQIRTITRGSEPGDAVLTVPDLSMLNFLAERDVPSAYYNLYEHHIASDQGLAVVEGSERRNVQLVMTRYDNFFSDRVGLLDYAPKLAHYIITHFERSFVGANEQYIVYQRRENPEPLHPFIDVLADCESPRGLVELNRHLLFSALYHKSHPLEPIPREGSITRCRVRVPDDGGVLSLEIGYRKPHHVQRGTLLRALIKLEHEGKQELLARETLRVVRHHGSNLSTPYKRIDADLARWAGEDVVIVFETYLMGLVQAHPLDFKGFSMVYRDPRLQIEPGGARP
jgi:hypothetical protein